MRRPTCPPDAAFDVAQLPVADPLGAVRETAVKALLHLTSCDRVRNIFEVAFLRCEYTDELAPVEQRHLREREHCLGFCEALLQQAVARGQLPDDTDTRLASHLLYALIGGLMRDWVQAPTQLRPEGRRAAGGRPLPGRPSRRAAPQGRLMLRG